MEQRTSKPRDLERVPANIKNWTPAQHAEFQAAALRLLDGKPLEAVQERILYNVGETFREVQAALIERHKL